MSVVDVVLSADPTDSLSIWVNYDWFHQSGSDSAVNGDAHGISGAGRLALSDDMGISTRVEYIWTEDDLTGGDDGELLTLTGTVDKTLAEGLVGRLELRSRELDSVPDTAAVGRRRDGCCWAGHHLWSTFYYACGAISSGGDCVAHGGVDLFWY